MELRRKGDGVKVGLALVSAFVKTPASAKSKADKPAGNDDGLSI